MGRDPQIELLDLPLEEEPKDNFGFLDLGWQGNLGPLEGLSFWSMSKEVWFRLSKYLVGVFKLSGVGQGWFRFGLWLSCVQI